MRHVLAFAALTLGLATVFAQSQLGTGAISGVVEDSTGGIVTGAQLTITNVETGLVRMIASGSSGQFFAPVLPPGSYQIRVAKPGFSTLEQNDIVVSVGGTATITAVLQVGAVSETVKVEAQAMIDVAATDVSSLVDRKEKIGRAHV